VRVCMCYITNQKYMTKNFNIPTTSA